MDGIPGPPGSTPPAERPPPVPAGRSPSSQRTPPPGWRRFGLLLGAGFTAFLQGVLGEGPAGPLLQTLRAGFRWSAALVVAFSSSVVVYLGSVAVLLTLVLAFARADRVFDAAAWIAPFGCFSLTGFAGVFFGTLVLEPPSRRIGSWILLAVGLGFYGLATRNLSYLRAPEVARELPHLWPLAIGGAVAGGWFLWKSSRVASARTPGQADR